ncbi:MAG: recombination regulator RecX [Thiobacillaceae bacterium]
MSDASEDRPLPPLRDRALAYLARREHSRQELANKLALAGYLGTDIEAQLDELTRRGLLSNERFAEDYVASKQGRFGALKLTHDLRSRGVDESIVQMTLAAATETELERARSVWNKRFGAPPANALEKAKQLRFLQNRGFSLETIYQVLG